MKRTKETKPTARDPLFIGPRRIARITRTVCGPSRETWRGRRGPMSIMIRVAAQTHIDDRPIEFTASLYKQTHCGRAATVSNAIEQLEQLWIENGRPLRRASAEMPQHIKDLLPKERAT